MAKCILLVLFLWLGKLTGAAAQDTDSLSDNPVLEKKYYLVLDKPGKVKRLRFYVGSRINFRLTNEKHDYTGVITAITPQAIVVHYTQIPLNEIARITIPQRSNSGRLLTGVGNVLRGAGGLFFLVGAGNYLLKPEDREDGRVTAQSGLSAFLVGQLFRGFQKRTYKLNKNRQLKTIQII